MFTSKKIKFFKFINFVKLYSWFLNVGLFYRYRDFKKSIKQLSSGKSIDAARQAVESLILVYLGLHTMQKIVWR